MSDKAQKHQNLYDPGDKVRIGDLLWEIYAVQYDQHGPTELRLHAPEKC